MLRAAGNYDLGQKEKSRFFYKAVLILNPETWDRKLLEARIAEMSR